MVRRILPRAGPLLAMLAVLLAPNGVKAGSLDLSSSMSATCLGTDCSRVRFTLDVVGDVYVSQVTITSSNAAIWKFGSVVSVPSGWASSISSPSQLTLTTAGADLVADPLSVTVDMSTWGTNDQFQVMNYAANGYQTVDESGSGCLSSDQPGCTGNSYFSTTGTVTPEPFSMVLLGSGLLGVAGVGRRKKTLLEEDEEA